MDIFMDTSTNMTTGDFDFVVTYPWTPMSVSMVDHGRP